MPEPPTFFGFADNLDTMPEPPTFFGFADNLDTMPEPPTLFGYICIAVRDWGY